MPPRFTLPKLDLPLDGIGLRHGAAMDGVGRQARAVLGRLGAWLRAALIPKTQEEERGSATLWLAVASSRWEAVVQGPELPQPAHFGEDCAFASEEGPLSSEAVVRRALAAIPDALKATIGRVVLASADPAFEFTDNRALRIPDLDAEAARSIASQQFGGAAASFGFVPFGQSSEREQQRRLYAFAPADTLRSYLYGLDKLALSLTSLIPLPALLLAEMSAAEAAEPCAILFVGDRFAQILIVNGDTGAVVARTVPIGALSLAAAIADEFGIPLRQAAAGLARRDRVSRLSPDRPDAGIAAQTTLGALLAAPLRELRDALEETFTYFAHQRLAGDPERILLCGEADRIPGFANWLASSTGLPVQVEARPWHQILMQSGAGSINLLQGAADDLLTIGKTAYHFRNGRFVPEHGDAPSAATLNAKPAAQGVGKLGELLDRVPWVRAPETRYFAGFAALLLLAALFDWKSFVVPAGAAVEANAASYVALLAENQKIEARRIADLEAEAEDQAASLDPGSWSERLVAIAHHIGPSVWLRRVSLAEPARGRRDVHQLVLEGRLPKSGDYLATIGSFVDELNDEEGFMRGLKSLGFEGAKVGDENAPYVDFALTASFGATAKKR